MSRVHIRALDLGLLRPDWLIHRSLDAVVRWRHPAACAYPPRYNRAGPVPHGPLGTAGECAVVGVHLRHGGAVLLPVCDASARAEHELYERHRGRAVGADHRVVVYTWEGQLSRTGMW